MPTIKVLSRTISPQTPAVGALPTITIDLLHETLTVANLIQRTVEAQIREILAARTLSTLQAQQALNRQYLPQDELAQQYPTASSDSNSPAIVSPSSLNTAYEVLKAQRAFEKRAYLIVADGRLLASLDEIISLRFDHKITFLRLQPLIGG